MKTLFTLLFGLLLGSVSSAQIWQTQNPNFVFFYYPPEFFSIVDGQTIWASKRVAEFTKTTNGGNLWTAGNYDEINNDYASVTSLFFIKSMTATSAQNSWVCTYYDANGTSYGDVWKTIDGGTTWIKKFTYPEQYKYPQFMHFFDDNIGIVISQNPEGFQPDRRYVIYRTIDGGNTWTKNLNSPNTPGTAGYYDYSLGDAYYFWETRVGGKKIMKTLDKGATFSFIDKNFAGGDMNLMAWSDLNKGIVVEQNWNVYMPMTFWKTIDGGDNWTQIISSGIPLNWISDIAYIPGTNKLIAVGQNGNNTNVHGSFISVDDGATWTPIDPGVYHDRVSCDNSGTCYSSGFNSATLKGVIYKMTGLLSASEAVPQWQGIYPNPAENEINIKTEKKIKNSTILDMSGRVILSVNAKKIDVSALPKGVYVLNVQFEDGSNNSERIIKK